VKPGILKECIWFHFILYICRFMSLQIALVGLPNVGKSTLFNALTKSFSATAENFPFCTIDPNVGIVPLEDERLSALAKASKAKNIIPATIEFVDVAGLVKGASQGEGLGNQFLAHIRQCDAVAMVLRFFQDENVTHVSGALNPKEDREIIETELILADLQTAEKALEKAKKNAKSGGKDASFRVSALEKIKNILSQGKKVKEAVLSEEEEGILTEISFLTEKPFLYVANVSEDEAESFNEVAARSTLVLASGDQLISISAKIESELSGLSQQDAKEFLSTMGLSCSGLQKLAHASHALLGLSRYFTAGEQEARAWTIPIGTLAPQAAGVIHTDFEKGFIRADVTEWDNFVKYDGWSGCREKGLVRSEGKTYLVQDGDVCLFRFQS
jgi:GTP-binding protein YchF